MGMMAIYRKPRTSRPYPQHENYPYLLRNMTITRFFNQAWCAGYHIHPDETRLPAPRGELAWHSRTGCLSNTVGADFCASTREDAMNRFGVPEIFNTDHGSQFTSYEFTRPFRICWSSDLNGWSLYEQRHD